MAKHEPDPGMMMAKSSLMSCTWTETMKMLEPDRHRPLAS